MEEPPERRTSQNRTPRFVSLRAIAPHISRAYPGHPMLSLICPHIVGSCSEPLLRDGVLAYGAVAAEEDTNSRGPVGAAGLPASQECGWPAFLEDSPRHLHDTNRRSTRINLPIALSTAICLPTICLLGQDADRHHVKRCRHDGPYGTSNRTQANLGRKGICFPFATEKDEVEEGRGEKAVVARRDGMGELMR